MDPLDPLGGEKNERVEFRVDPSDRLQAVRLVVSSEWIWGTSSLLPSEWIELSDVVAQEEEEAMEKLREAVRLLQDARQRQKKAKDGETLGCRSSAHVSAHVCGKSLRMRHVRQGDRM